MAGLCTRLWVLQVNLWLLALVTGGISAGKNNTSNSTDDMCPPVHQHPRYVMVKKNMPIYFICYSHDLQNMQWYKTTEKSENICGMDENTFYYGIQRTETFINLTIFRATYKDSAIYVCDRKNLTEKKYLHACGTELRVVGHSNIQQIQNRNTLKDAIIIIQSILLVILISIPILLLLDRGEGKKYPEEDHTYEGLEVEQMATYEDITPFRDVKAKWTVGEHPGEE